MTMKVCIIQPKYEMDHAKTPDISAWILEMLDKCDDSMDLIVLPESSDAPCFPKDEAELLQSYHANNRRLIEKCAETAKRCGAHLFVNALHETPTGLRNTTYAFDRTGCEVGHYDKQHLTPGERTHYHLDSDYTFEYEDTTVIELDGIRYAFLTCYDFYFYEGYAKLARAKPDIIIGCSQQRSDPHDVSEMMTKFAAYNTNAYVVRASVCMNENGTIGGASMVVSPRGEVLMNLRSQVGMDTVEIDPKKKFYKPGGFGNPDMAHYEYIEKGRRPWKYRPAGPAIVRHDALMPYPRICAHRGFNSIAPENSMPAFGAAIALGAEEIEFDLWMTKDGEIVSLHDSRIDRVSDGHGQIWDLTYEELLQYDFGIRHGEEFRGLKILKFEEILKKFAGQVIMNVHVKDIRGLTPDIDEAIVKIIALIRQYDCEKYCYFMTGNVPMLQRMRELAPEIARCAGAETMGEDLVDKALETDSCKIQLFQPHFGDDPDGYVKAACEKAHANNIAVNVFWADDPALAKHYLDLGCDVILTNDYQRVSLILK